MSQRSDAISVLVVVAHPDDEVLGCGGVGAALAAQGHRVQACILSGSADARQHRPEGTVLAEHARAASACLGFVDPLLGDFPNIEMNVVPHLQLVQFIERAIGASAATVIFTHHPNDLNDDHLHVARACRAAARLAQRGAAAPSLRSLLHMEILSSSDWAFRGEARGFEPDTFAELGEEFVSRKLAALRTYAGVMRPYPHPRSDEAIRALATLRGAQAGVMYAEAFQTAYRAVGPGMSF